ncbi:hypothetical protein [Virgibacillus oceani]|uniref:Uncharacterized protein n=1 Tax=Virgibacillus oceani TaxID=1479511 RepID=A0A917M6X1_9BACI|nr:hypothetical protein [Virgibacillus oceani]GGG81258.1 hypothetical protein GCM10011398_28330 [Virgibacillus oceani]
MRKLVNLNTVYVVAAIVAIGTIIIVWASEMSGIWTKGISHVANAVEEYHNAAFPVDGEFTVDIDLSDLESNEGKVLFDDGKNQIFVSKVVRNESDYEVVFRSSGDFSLGGATLVSGIEHVRNSNDLTTDFQAEAQASYMGDTYKLSPSGSSGLDYRDGDEFGFYLYRQDETIDIDLEKESMIEVTVTNLYMNLWAEKS